MLYRLVRILDRRGETVEGKFEIALDQNGEMFFTSSSDSARTRFFLNFYGLSSTASLNDPKGKYPTNITAREAFERKKVDYELDKMKDEKGNPLVIPDNIALGMINIIYTMKLTEYQKYETTTVATNISNETMVEINENAADLKGVAVEQSYVRKYEDSIYFAPIIGYTGKVQEDQLSALNEQWHQSDEAAGLPEDAPDKYDLNDIVGRIGIEKSMELELQGEKGYSWPSVGSVSSIQSSLPTQPSRIALSTPRIKSSSSTVPMNTKGRAGSSPVLPVNSTISENAVMAQARPDFMSQAPLPYRRTSFTTAPRAGVSSSHPSPSITVSIWHMYTRAGAGACSLPGMRAIRLKRPGITSLWTSSIWFLSAPAFSSISFVNHSYIHCSIWPS